MLCSFLVVYSVCGGGTSVSHCFVMAEAEILQDGFFVCLSCFCFFWYWRSNPGRTGVREMVGETGWAQELDPDGLARGSQG